MNNKHIEIISRNLSVLHKQVLNTIELLGQGATIPFISRYRKELTGSLDEVQITQIRDLYEKFIELEKRRESILNSIEKQEKLTDELRDKINSVYDTNELEDLYLPYKQKKKTRASAAKEKGLEPLALTIYKQSNIDIDDEALRFLNDDVTNTDEALQGARDIIAEIINEDKRTRDVVRYEFKRSAIVSSKVVNSKKEEAAKYSDYFEFDEALSKIPSHRLMAILRAEREGLLRVKINPDKEYTVEKINRLHIKGKNQSSKQVSQAVEDSYKRLLEPSIETEYRNLAKEKADKEAIDVFSQNLRQLLLAAPLGEKRILAIDPGYRTGCKVVCLDNYGNLLHNETIYPHAPQNETLLSAKKISSLVNSYQIDAIAIGNGTAGRETESFIRNVVKFDRNMQVFVVNEDGASVYSASKVAREEFPEYDVTVRGSVSIGRRLADPLAELVKIDPKSIGVGQYQHDVDQKMLQKSLDTVVESCVNTVGVDLNTAGKYLLNYVSGLGIQLAQNLVEYRNEVGGFKSRSELKKVKRLGEKAFEQSAGFLRIRNGKNLLDNTAVHPESYYIVEKMAKSSGVKLKEFIENPDLRKGINLTDYVDSKTGIPTLKDIMNELDKPGRDPREQIKVFEFSKDVFKIEDLKIGMVIPGIVTNITNFGAFVDVGVKQDGLVHISQLADRFVANPNEVVKLNQHVKVKIVEVDIERKRIQLSMKDI